MKASWMAPGSISTSLLILSGSAACTGKLCVCGWFRDREKEEERARAGEREKERQRFCVCCIKQGGREAEWKHDTRAHAERTGCLARLASTLSTRVRALRSQLPLSRFDARLAGRAITTMSTIGYGDISASTPDERTVSVIVMVSDERGECMAECRWKGVAVAGLENRDSHHTTNRRRLLSQS